MDLEVELEDRTLLTINAPVCCPSCDSVLTESEDTGNRVCAKGFPPCCYLYWNRKEKKPYWKEKYGPDDRWNNAKGQWEKRESTERVEVKT